MFEQYNKNKRRRILNKKLQGNSFSFFEQIKHTGIVIFSLLVILILTFLFSYVAQIRYTRYDVLYRDNLVKATESLENDLSYTEFLEGMLKISKDGVSYLSNNANTEWNVSYNLKNPVVVKSKEYFAIIDKGYGDLYIFSKTGLEGHNKTVLPIMDAAISEYGDLYVVLSDDLSSIISIFTKNGTELENKIKTVISGNGYAVGLDCSDDAHLIMAPFTYVDAGEIKSKLCFYYINESIENDINNVNGLSAGFDEEFEKTLIGKVQFFNNKNAFAITNENLVFFNILNSRIPRISKVIRFEKRVKTIASSSDNLLVLFEDGEVSIFDKTGKENKWRDEISYGYSFIEISHGYVYFVINNELKIYTMSGRIIFEGEFEDEINCVIPQKSIFGFNLLVAFKNNISHIKLLH